MKPTELTQLALLGAIAYIIWKALQKFEAGAAVITEPLARAYVNLTSGPPVQVLGAVKLPDGRQIRIQQIVDAGGRITGAGLFTWGGAQYQISGRDASGAYVAKRLIT